VSSIIAESLPNLARRWRIRIDKGRSALEHGFRSLSAEVTRGVQIELPLGAHRSFWSGPCGDADLIEFLARALPDDGLFLDVGGNIGLYSASLWRLRGAMRGVAFEPIPSTQALLQSTFELNGVPFAIERAAVSDSAGTLTLCGYAHGLNNFWIKNDDGRHPTISVPTIALDDWCGSDPGRIPGAIKIDVEGHELAVLKGARKMFHTHRPAMVMECHAGSWDELGVSRAELDAEVRGIGYQRLCDRNGRPVDFLGARETFHMLAIP
jgi:FkbM family methyltransferase